MPSVTPAYDLTMPGARTSALVFSSPHSGRAYPRQFLQASVLDETAIRSSEDAFVDLLFGDAPRHGAPLLAARAPRAYVDLNRSPEELDPALIAGLRLPAHNPRVSSGLGVIPRVVSNGRAIYHGKITEAEAMARIATCWEPYHACLHALMHESRALFGAAILIDCHSMPHEAIAGHCRGGSPAPQVVLGDRFGASAAAEVTDRIEAAFAAAGMRVARNSPFAGAYIAQAFGRPSRGHHVVQVEIDRALYMDERTIRPNEDFDAVRAMIGRVIGDIVDMLRPEDRALAAE